MITAYEILGVPPMMDTDLIHDKYLELAWENHPDRYENEPAIQKLKADRFKAIATAWSEIKDRKDREQYNKRLVLEKRICTRCKGEGVVAGFKMGRYNRGKECPECKGSGIVKRS